MSTNIFDFLVIGGGVIGISIARELKSRNQDCSVCILEKENQFGLHASGRNSGVLHAGFYYTANSLKARFTKEGNQRLTEYCEAKNLALKKCGKLVVVQNESELVWLDELMLRAKNNGVPLELITDEESLTIEPRAKTYQKALFSPTTASINPTELVKSLLLDAIQEGVQLKTNTQYIHRSCKNSIKTSNGTFEAKYIINAAGLYADKIGRDFNFSKDYRILPFKGLYLYSNEPQGALKTHIYPVPDLTNPFLGVHFTITSDGRTKIGPTAIPAFWREQYKGWNNFNIPELTEIILRQAGLFLSSNFDFKALAFRELKKYSKPLLVSLATKLAKGVNIKHYRQWGQAGIRAQLLNIRKKELEMDFVLEGDKQSMHILNAVSPGLTCALPFADYVCDQIEGKIKEG
ncbi:MAG: L-2-hydroxyglutarate oxidase [Nitrospina sp.]|nr:L-2-hydroxyglutarate oxidase [Nitrospina sp.]MBT6600930.1 L-2-hydroxyglutarate oxidase [Nitrospina sp.]